MSMKKGKEEGGLCLCFFLSSFLFFRLMYYGSIPLCCSSSSDSTISLVFSGALVGTKGFWDCQ